jgi:integrase
VNGESIGFHSLRHAFIGKARKLKLPERTVMAQTGHLTRCAFDRYGGQADDDELASLIGIMERGKVVPS